jgi:L-cysteine S-thiosulfotransferase
MEAEWVFCDSVKLGVQSPKIMKKYSIIMKIGTFALLMFLTACGGKEKKMAKGFVLPKGDIEKGMVAFTELKCHSCHTVSGEVFPKLAEESGVQLQLGGEVRKLKSYGELVTSIINPQHSISKEYLSSFEKDQREGVESPMSSVNDQMTVEQMVNLVEFLNSRYMKYETDIEYPYYGPTFYGP